MALNGGPLNGGAIQGAAPRGGSIRTRLLSRYAARSLYATRLITRYAALTQQHLDSVYSGGSTTTSNSVRQYEDGYDCQVYALLRGALGDSTHEIERGYELRITMGESQPATWELSITDEDGTYHPENASSPWHGVLDSQMFDGTVVEVPNTNPKLYIPGPYGRYMTAIVRQGGYTWQWSGVPNNLKTTGSFPDPRYNMAWGGVDESHALFQRELTLRTRRSLLNKVVWSNDLIARLLALYGFGYNPTNVENYPVPVMHMQGNNLMGLIQQLLTVPCAEWYFEGQTLVAYVPQYTGQPNWTYDLQTDILYDYDDDSGQTGNAIDKVLVSRAPEAGQTQKTIDSTTWGTQTLTFDPPLDLVNWRVLGAYNGRFTDFIGKNIHGTIVAYSTPGTTGANGQAPAQNNWNGIATFQCTWGQPAPGSTVSNAFSQGRLLVRGKLPYNTGAFGVSDGIFTASLRRGIGAYPKELDPNEQIPNGAWLLIHGARMLQRLGRTERTIRFGVPLNLGLRVGHVVREVDARRGIDRRVYVNQVTHVISRDHNRRRTEYSASVYPSLDNVTTVTNPTPQVEDYDPLYPQ